VNYRHHFHAGNFADLVKHAALLHLLAAATARPEPLFVLDTHAGAGLYDLSAARTGEAASGIGRLMVEPSPPAFNLLRRAVKARNPGGGSRFYPGSPRLIADALRPGDRYVACELRPDDHAALRGVLKGARGRVEALRLDGYVAVRERLPRDGGNTLVLIDPPYERGDEYANVASAVAQVLERSPPALVCIWAPLKDLETFDALVRSLEALAPSNLLIAETRLRPLDDPLKLNGCALALVNAPVEIEAPLGEIVAWTAERLGDEGAAARVWRP
jgi:23S rRNA (adenine2030-N6)-methyltransferase